MLQVQHICKEYQTGKLIQKALDDVSLNLRDNEFVAILGPSGSGKTTFLNIIGGLDRYDSGDLIINGVSTKKYNDRDWDSYRNHTIGFVFQSYNLIPHQTVLVNVELALTISGIGRAERRERAVKALEEVGLGDQLHKKPNQMSGGQMQRVAIARALVNDPDILLADEPTGALDSDTSVQVMELLREVAKDRLVVMVTHNPELAEEYATRIVKLKDGKIRSDTDAFEPAPEGLQEPEHRNLGKSSMSFRTALSLSFNNLKTKKARTLLTSFAGSIGIIGIALILALSTGVNAYIQSVEEDTLSEYPLQIQSTGVDFTSMMMPESAAGSDGGEKKDSGDINVIPMITNVFSKMNSNDLGALKEYLDSGDSNIEKYTKSVEYSYNVAPQIYRQDGKKIRQVHPDKTFDAMGFGSSTGSNSMMSAMMSTDIFYEMPEEEDLYKTQYDVKAGRWPEKYNECVVVLTSGGSMSDFMLYTLGLRDAEELDDMVRQFMNEEDVEAPSDMGSYTYDQIVGQTFKLVNSSDYYEYDKEYKVWKDKSDDKKYLKKLVKSGEDIEIVGVVQPSEEAKGVGLSPGIYYTPSLTKHTIEEAAKSEIVKKQLANKKKDVFTNEKFGEESESKGLDSESLFTIDEDALKDVFQFDEDALTKGLSKMDLSGTDFSKALGKGSKVDFSKMINLGDVDMDIPQFPGLSAEDLMAGIKIEASAEDMNRIAKELIAGYKDYAKQYPEADYTKLYDSFGKYLQSSGGQKIISDNIQKILTDNGEVKIPKEELRKMVEDILGGYLNYCENQNFTDADQFGSHLNDYLNSGDGQAKLKEWSEKGFPLSSDVKVSQEQIRKLSAELAVGYGIYAKQEDLPDPSKMGEHFLKYLSTDQAKKILSEGIKATVDTEKLEKQMSGTLGKYMQSVMGSYTAAMSKGMEQYISKAMEQIVSQIGEGLSASMKEAMSGLGKGMQDALTINTDAFQKAFRMNMDEEDLTEILMSMGARENATYDNNLKKLGYADLDVPSGIDIYPKDFENKEHVTKILDDYNDRMEKEGKEEQVITYTDMVGTLMSSVTDIIDTISYVLIAFVAISLVVSSIMIGVITYISVLERKKEIGILRAIGASKGNVSQVFNAETFIIGLCAGVIGIGLTLLMLIPGNFLIHEISGNPSINAVLPAKYALILIALSVILTLLGGLIPSSKAAKSDPVTALRTE